MSTSEKIERNPNLLKKGMVFKFPAGLVEDYIQDHFEFVEWIPVDGRPDGGIKFIVRKPMGLTWSSLLDKEYTARWSKDSFVEIGFVIISPHIKVEYKRIKRRRA